MVGLINRQRSKPLIAAVEGAALGGGPQLILCCDLVVASSRAAFGLPEVERGSTPDFGGAFRIGRFLPTNVAGELPVTANNLTAERAGRLGFLTHVVDPGKPLPAAPALAARVCDSAPLAVREALAVSNAEVTGDESAGWSCNSHANARLLQTADLIEGPVAFFEKRPT